MVQISRVIAGVVTLTVDTEYENETFFFWFLFSGFSKSTRERSPGQQILAAQGGKSDKTTSAQTRHFGEARLAPHSSPNIADKGPHQPHHESTARTGITPGPTRLSRDIQHTANEVARVRDALSIFNLLTSSVVDWSLLGERPAAN